MRALQIFLVFLVTVPLILAGTVYGLFVIWGKDLPSPKRPQEMEPSRNTVLLDRNGQIMDELFVENRSPLPLQQIPEVVRQAVLSTEDRRFYRHWGVDMTGVVRAVVSNLSAGGIRQGASTISQQLARNVFLTHSQTLERKLKEAVLAIRMERSLSKEEILELYLNKIYFGEGAYGIEAASQRYFGKSCRYLSLPEAALLAGLPANPSAYSPIRHPEAARRRRNSVLRRMEATGAIDAESRDQAEASEIELSPARHGSSSAPYFVEMVRQELIDRYGTEAVYKGGLTVHTTLDPVLQQAAVHALEDHLSRIEKDHASYYRHTSGVSIRGEGTGAGSNYLQGALVAVEPQSGAIRALVGGRDFDESNFNRAVQARRQPGSAFKPILVAQALRQGYKTNDVLEDSPVTFEWDDQTWSPQNFTHRYLGPVTLRYVLVKSINVPSARLIEAIGPRAVVRMARDLGFTGPMSPNLSLALGTAEVSPLEITAAYATFANHGIRQDTYAIESVEDASGRPLEEHRPQPEEILDEKTDYLMVSMLQSVVDRGTGFPARARYGFNAPAGGKTGTTDDYTDAWFVGFTPDLACGVWVGFDTKKPIGPRMTGAAAALPIWTKFMQKAVETYGAREFRPPDGIVFVRTCQTSGLLAGPNCPRVFTDAFVAGTEPYRVCTLAHLEDEALPEDEYEEAVDSEEASPAAMVPPQGMGEPR